MMAVARNQTTPPQDQPAMPSETITIRSREDLKAWLKDKPADWARAIAVRAALRVLPIGVRYSNERGALAVFRATFFAIQVGMTGGREDVRRAAAARAAVWTSIKDDCRFLIDVQ